MRPVFCSILLVLWVVQAPAEWTDTLLEAWARMPATLQADADWDQARADKALADLAWLPLLTLGTTPSGTAPLMGVQSSNTDRVWSGTLAATVKQSLPGGGTLGVNAVRSVAVSRDAAPWTTTMGAEASVPLGGTDSRRAASLALQKAELQWKTARRAAFVSVVTLAAAVDKARADLTWKQSLERVASERRRIADSLQAQGRLSRVEAAVAQRGEREARWSRIEAESTLARAERDWLRHAAEPLPPQRSEDILLDRTRLPADWSVVPSDEPLYRLELERSREQDRIDRSGGVPVLGWTASVTEASARSWSSQISLTWSPDSLIRAGRLDDRLRSEERLWTSRAEDAAKVKKDRTEAAVSRVGALLDEIARREAAQAQLRKVSDDLRATAASGQATTADLLAAEAEVLAVDAEIRGLRWELVLAELGG